LIVVPSLEAGIDKAKTFGTEEVFVTGGGEIFKMAIEKELVDRIYLTRVHAEVEGDTYFPAFDQTKWEKVKDEHYEKDEKHKYSMSFQVWDFKK
jgi:dihydrofolate reductase